MGFPVGNLLPYLPAWGFTTKPPRESSQTEQVNVKQRHTEGLQKSFTSPFLHYSKSCLDVRTEVLIWHHRDQKLINTMVTKLGHGDIEKAFDGFRCIGLELDGMTQ